VSTWPRCSFITNRLPWIISRGIAAQVIPIIDASRWA
jgi:hypothetical protein